MEKILEFAKHFALTKMPTSDRDYLLIVIGKEELEKIPIGAADLREIINSDKNKTFYLKKDGDTYTEIDSEHYKQAIDSRDENLTQKRVLIFPKGDRYLFYYAGSQFIPHGDSFRAVGRGDSVEITEKDGQIQIVDSTHKLEYLS